MQHSCETMASLGRKARPSHDLQQMWFPLALVSGTTPGTPFSLYVWLSLLLSMSLVVLATSQRSSLSLSQPLVFQRHSFESVNMACAPPDRNLRYLVTALLLCQSLPGKQHTDTWANGACACDEACAQQGKLPPISDGHWQGPAILQHSSFGSVPSPGTIHKVTNFTPTPRNQKRSATQALTNDSSRQVGHVDTVHMQS